MFVYMCWFGWIQGPGSTKTEKCIVPFTSKSACVLIYRPIISNYFGNIGGIWGLELIWNPTRTPISALWGQATHCVHIMFTFLYGYVNMTLLHTSDVAKYYECCKRFNFK